MMWCKSITKHQKLCIFHFYSRLIFFSLKMKNLCQQQSIPPAIKYSYPGWPFLSGLFNYPIISSTNKSWRFSLQAFPKDQGFYLLIRGFRPPPVELCSELKERRWCPCRRSIPLIGSSITPYSKICLLSTRRSGGPTSRTLSLLLLL